MAILPDDQSDFEHEVARIRSTEWLGRSPGIIRLFDYLVVAALDGRAVREIELAQDIFGRRVDLEGDASVRVYVHRLRKKLTTFYETGPGQGAVARLTLPMGGYALAVTRIESEPPSSPAPTAVTVAPAQTVPLPVILAFALLLIAIVAATSLLIQDARGSSALERSALWQGFGRQRPILVVVGDYYIFGETDAQGEVSRMVREFAVDSASDLERFRSADPAAAAGYVDLDTTYTPVGATIAMRSVMPAVDRLAHGRAVRVIVSSQLTPDLLKTSDIVYLGYLSGMRVLEAPVFAGARMQLGGGYDELVDSRSNGKSYVSTAGAATAEQENSDYAYLRRLAGPGGNIIVVIAGTRDVGVVQASEIATAQPDIAAASRPGGAYEALYRVRGLGRTSLASEPVILGDAAPRGP